MMVCADKYLSLKFDEQNFNCWAFVRLVWRDLTRVDLGDLTPGPQARRWYGQRRALDAAARIAALSPAFVRLLRPESPCLALALRSGWTPHIGVVMRSNVLHLTESGARYEPVEAFGTGFDEVAFYRPAPVSEHEPEPVCA